MCWAVQVDQSSPAPGDGETLPANWEQERFTVLALDSARRLLPLGRLVSIIGPAGGTVCTDGGAGVGSGALTVETLSGGGNGAPDRCGLTVVDAGFNNVALLTAAGSYVRALDGVVDHALRQVDTTQLTFQSFRVVDGGNDRLALLTAMGTFLSVDTAGVVQLNSLGAERTSPQWLRAANLGPGRGCGAGEFRHLHALYLRLLRHCTYRVTSRRQLGRRLVERAALRLRLLRTMGWWHDGVARWGGTVGVARWGGTMGGTVGVARWGGTVGVARWG